MTQLACLSFYVTDGLNRTRPVSCIRPCHGNVMAKGLAIGSLIMGGGEETADYSAEDWVAMIPLSMKEAGMTNQAAVYERGRVWPSRRSS